MKLTWLVAVLVAVLAPSACFSQITVCGIQFTAVSGNTRILNYNADLGSSPECTPGSAVGSVRLRFSVSGIANSQSDSITLTVTQTNLPIESIEVRVVGASTAANLFLTRSGTGSIQSLGSISPSGSGESNWDVIPSERPARPRVHVSLPR